MYIIYLLFDSSVKHLVIKPNNFVPSIGFIISFNIFLSSSLFRIEPVKNPLSISNRSAY